jgi:hypothetical protein
MFAGNLISLFSSPNRRCDSGCTAGWKIIQPTQDLTVDSVDGGSADRRFARRFL